LFVNYKFNLSEIERHDKRLRASLLVGASFLAFSIIAPSTAFAASPHFIGTPIIIKFSNFGIAADFKVAGLANIVTGVFLTSSGGTANLQCQNPGGNSPPPKQVSFGPLQGQTIFVQPRNGQITVHGGGTLGPPPIPSAAQICPNPNWHVVILSVIYTGVVLHIQQNGADVLIFNFGTVTVP
jgi:hypothetical protein